MVEEIATVVAAENDGVWLTTTPQGTCNSCQVSSDCGTGIVTKALTPRQQRFFLPTTLSLLPGEQVRIGVAEQPLLMAAFMVYLLPLLLLVLCAALASYAGLTEGLVILCACAGAAAGFFIARRYSQQQTPAQHIRILEVLSALAVVKNT